MRGIVFIVFGKLPGKKLEVWRHARRLNADRVQRIRIMEQQQQPCDQAKDEADGYATTRIHLRDAADPRRAAEKKTMGSGSEQGNSCRAISERETRGATGEEERGAQKKEEDCDRAGCDRAGGRRACGGLYRTDGYVE
jgi:hypothetical protein